MLFLFKQNKMWDPKYRGNSPPALARSSLQYTNNSGAIILRSTHSSESWIASFPYPGSNHVGFFWAELLILLLTLTQRLQASFRALTFWPACRYFSSFLCKFSLNSDLTNPKWMTFFHLNIWIIFQAYFPSHQLLMIRYASYLKWNNQ